MCVCNPGHYARGGACTFSTPYLPLPVRTVNGWRRCISFGAMFTFHQCFCCWALWCRYRWKQVSDGGALPRAGLIVPDPETFQPEAYKPTRFRMRTKFNVVASMLVNAVRAKTTLKLASYIQVEPCPFACPSTRLALLVEWCVSGYRWTPSERAPAILAVTSCCCLCVDPSFSLSLPLSSTSETTTRCDPRQSVPPSFPSLLLPSVVRSGSELILTRCVPYALRPRLHYDHHQGAARRAHRLAQAARCT